MQSHTRIACLPQGNLLPYFRAPQAAVRGLCRYPWQQASKQIDTLYTAFCAPAQSMLLLDDAVRTGEHLPEEKDVYLHAMLTAATNIAQTRQHGIIAAGC